MSYPVGTKSTWHSVHDSRLSKFTSRAATGKLNGSAAVWLWQRLPSDLGFDRSRVTACVIRSGKDGCRRLCLSFNIPTLCCNISMPSRRWTSQLLSSPLTTKIEHYQHTCTHARMHARTRAFNGHFSRTTWVGQYQKGKTNLDFTEARDSEWQWHQLGHMQVCTSLQTDNHASTSPLSFLQAGCPSRRSTNSVKALEVKIKHYQITV